MKTMKLKKFRVEKLFNTFDHEIEINSLGITIVIGENGIGKTVVLEMLEAIFNKHFNYLYQVIFNKIFLEFDDGDIWLIEKSEEKKKNIPIVTLQHISSKTNKTSKITLFKFDKNDFSISGFVAQHPYLRRMGLNVWQDIRTGDTLTREDMLERYNDELMAGLFLNEPSELPPQIMEKIQHNNVSLIKTQRLLYIDERNRSRTAPVKTVAKYSEDLKVLIKSSLAQSTDLSSKLDRTYPNRMIEKINRSEESKTDDITSELKRLEEKRELLDKVGLIEIDKESKLQEIEENQKENETLKYVLQLYIEDSFEKLKIFDEPSQKIKMFLDIINKRFKHKKMFIDKEKGFLFKSTILLENEIPVDKLSSGEQNELVLFYELLFKSNKDSLILIDEPEISLHISWQNTFIHDLKEIAKLNDLTFLIATHSPDIISNNWDLRVELKGVE
ncbi:ATP-binding protein [Spirochaetia bacterium]|nr:ATP-binding protein [Spirochaetia bacterium]